MWGSSASRRASPTKLTESVVMAMATADGNHSQGIVCRMGSDMASCNMLPQLDMGSWTPRPRKLRADSVMMAPAKPHGGRHNHRGDRIGEDVTEDDAAAADADTARGQHEFPLAQRKKLGAHMAHYSGPAKNPDDNHDIEDVGRQDHGDGDDKHEGGEAHHDIGEATQNHVDTAAEIAGEATQDDADGGIDTDGDEADGERDPGAIGQARPDIPTQRVGAQNMGRRRRLPHHGQVDAVGIVEGYERRKYGDQRKEGQSCQA